MRPRKCCCGDKYTTRYYDPSGAILWSANFYDGATTVAPNYICQAIDGSRVYVGGDRQYDGSTHWSLMAFDLTTGALDWSRDLQADAAATSAGYDTGRVQKLCIDAAGNIACLLYAKSTSSVQAVVVVTPAGALSAVHTFAPASSSYVATDFVVNAAGDYHMITGTNRIYDWAAGFGSAPTANSLLPINDPSCAMKCIRRIGGRDYIGMTEGGGTSVPICLVRGIVQSAAPFADADFDLMLRTTSPSTLGEGVSDIAVDSSGNIYGAGLSLYSVVTPRACYVRKWSSSGTILFDLPCAGFCVNVDSSDNVYTSGPRVTQTPSGGGPVGFAANYSIEKHDSSGTYQWGSMNQGGHWNQVCKQIDIDGTSGVVRSGNDDSMSDADAFVSSDSNLVADACPSSTPTCIGYCHYTATNPVTTTTDHDSGSGTFVSPSNGEITIEVWGGGGGGGTDSTTGTQGWQGGGSGGYAIYGPTPSGTGETFNWSVGTNGVGGLRTDPTGDGTDGTDSTVTGMVLLTGGGGRGGLGESGSNTGAGGSHLGQVGSVDGNPGSVNSGTTGGNGGSAPSGGTGGAGGASGFNGSNGSVPGAGGGGGGRRAHNGGDGAHGRIRIKFTTWDWLSASDTCSGTCSACTSVGAGFYTVFGRPVSGSHTIDVPCS